MDIFGKKGEIRMKRFPPTPMFFSGKKLLTCNLLIIFLRKLKYIFQKLSLQNNMFRNCLYKWSMCKQISNLCFHSFKKLSDIVASFINTGQMQYCVLPFYFLALCLPLLFCVSIFKIQTKHLLRKSQRKSRQNSRLPPTRWRI